MSEKLKDLKLWLSISNLRNVPHSLLLIARVNDFSYDKFEIDANETQDEVLRRVSATSTLTCFRASKMHTTWSLSECLTKHSVLTSLKESFRKSKSNVL